MKKITIILSAISAALLASCTVETPWEDRNIQDGTTTVSFTVNFASDGSSPVTKALAEKPDVKDLHLAVFNEDGKALVEYVKADPATTSLAKENGTAYKYTAKLKTSDKSRVIHFIANGPEELNYGSEEDAIGSLLYSFDKDSWTGEDAYWGYLELNDGICDNTNTTAYQSLCASLSSVVLIRNFAKIQVESAPGSNLKITRFWIHNFPDKSSAAPYNRDSHLFETSYASYSYAKNAISAGYKGFFPASSGLVSLSELDDLTQAQCDSTDNWTAYTYERELPVKDPLCIIVGGTSDLVGGDQETFYKIDLRDADGKYMPILRNFTYKIAIGNVEKVGASTVESAINSVGNGSIDTNMELQGLTNMSNGTSKITVSKTEAVIYSDDLEQLNYQYIPNLNADEDGDGMADMVNTTLDQLLNMGFASEAAVQEKHISYVKITRENGISGAIFSSMVVDDNDKDGSRIINLLPDDPMNGIPRTEVITITGYYYNPAPDKQKYETLTRTVNYQIRNRMEFYLKLNPTQVKGNITGEAVDLTIGIEDKLPSSLFTLDLTVIARNMSVTPAGNDLPIKTDLLDGKPVYCFTKAVTWEDYNNAPTYTDEDNKTWRLFVCHFKTNTNAYDSIDDKTNPNQGDYFVVTHKYFEDAGIELYSGTDELFRFRNLHFDKDYIVTGRSAYYSFTMSSLPSDNEVYIGVKNLTPVGLDLAGISDSQSEYNDFTVYKMPVSNLTETIAVTPVGDPDYAYIHVFDPEFNNVKCSTVEVHPLQFSDLKLVNLADEQKNYLVGDRTARISFHLDEMPSSSNPSVTLTLTNLTPVSTDPTSGKMTGISSFSGGSGSGSYTFVPSSQDITIDVTPVVGDNITAKYELSNAEFSNNSCSSVIKKLSFSNVKLLNMANITSDHVIGGKTARIYFTLEDMPTSTNQAITLTLTNLTPVSTTVGTGMTNITSITDKGSGVYEIVASDKNVTLDVIPTGGQANASFTVANNEFYTGNSGNVSIEKLSFLNAQLINTNDPTKGYVVGGKPAYISFALEDLPSSTNQAITLTMTNLTPVSPDPTSGEMTGISSFSGSNGSYTFVPSGKNITINVIPKAGDNLKASYSLANTEFKTTGNGVSNVEIKKLTFSNLKFNYPDGKTYLLAGGQASITFSVDQQPNDPDNKVTLYIKNASLTGLTPTGSSGDFTTYSVPVDSKTKTMNISVAAGKTEAEFYLSDNEFYAMATADYAKADVKTRYTIDWSKVQIWSDDPNAAAGGQSVSVYTDAACTTKATSLGIDNPFTTSNTAGNIGYAPNGTVSIDSADGSEKYYFKFTKNNTDYISEDGVTLATLANTTTVPQDVDVICKIQMITYTIEANSIFFTEDGSKAMGGLKSVSIRLGSNNANAEVASFNPSNGYNTAFEVRCKRTDSIYIHCLHNNGSKKYDAGPISITDLAEATTSNPYVVKGKLQ